MTAASQRCHEFWPSSAENPQPKRFLEDHPMKIKSFLRGASVTAVLAATSMVAAGAAYAASQHPDQRQRQQRHAPPRGRAWTRRMDRRRALDLEWAEALLQRLRRS